MNAPYAWAITKDYIWDVSGEQNDMGRIGPRHPLTDDYDRIVKEGRAFRMKDDDGEVYYAGYILTAPEAVGSELDFAPLEDFGTPNAGCTSIEYRNPSTNEWETL